MVLNLIFGNVAQAAALASTTVLQTGTDAFDSLQGYLTSTIPPLLPYLIGITFFWLVIRLVMRTIRGQG